jgi:hypothetical protein
MAQTTDVNDRWDARIKIGGGCTGGDDGTGESGADMTGHYKARPGGIKRRR